MTNQVVFLALMVGLVVDCAVGESKPRLRVLTYNIHHGEGTDGRFDYDRLARVITELAPDVVALQEVDRSTGRASGVDQLALLEKLTRMNGVFGRSFHFSGGEYGNAILSRFPLGEIQVHHLPFRFGQESRTAVSARIQPGNGLPEFILVSTHLSTKARGSEQVQQLNSIFPEGEGPPIVLAGDFNARPGSEPMNILLAQRWVDAVAPQSLIDYVLVRPGDPWRVVEVKTVEDRLTSDHRPVLVVLEWGE